MNEEKPDTRSKDTEKGAVLLTTILVMSLMATVAVGIMDDIRFALRRAHNVQAYAQADWYISGAQDYVQNYLGAVISNTDSTSLNTLLLQAKPTILPMQGGEITLSVKDGSDCISLGGLTGNDGQKLFRQLLDVIGLDSLGAANLTSIAADWVDSDSRPLPGGAEDYTYLGLSPAYRAANRPMSSVSELRALSSMNEKTFNALRGFVCARKNPLTTLNIDTLTLDQAPALAAVLGGVGQSATAQQLILSRPNEGYQTLEKLLAAPALSGATLDAKTVKNLVFSPQYLWVEAEVNTGQITRHIVMEFQIKDGELTQIFKRLGPDARRKAVLKDGS